MVSDLTHHSHQPIHTHTHTHAHPVPSQDHYIGIDVGTGSARACIIDSTGEIKALATQDIKLWQTSHGHDSTHYARDLPSPLPQPHQPNLTPYPPGTIHNRHLARHHHLRAQHPYVKYSEPSMPPPSCPGNNTTSSRDREPFAPERNRSRHTHSPKTRKKNDS